MAHDSDHNQSTEPESTPQQEANFRYFVKLNQLLFLVVVAAATVFVILRPTAPRVARLIIIAAITGSSLLVGRISSRVYGFSILAVATVLAVIGELAGPAWPMSSHEFEIMAISCGVMGLGLVFTVNRTGEADPRFEQAMGVMALAGLLGIAAFATWRGGSLAIWVASETVAALADSAGKKWKSRLAWIALLPLGALTVAYLRPEWQPQFSVNVRRALVFFAAHNHTWMIFPVIAAFGASALQAYNTKSRGKAALRVGFLVAGAIWLLLFVVDAS
jgi:hypothetical protein